MTAFTFFPALNIFAIFFVPSSAPESTGGDWSCFLQTWPKLTQGVCQTSGVRSRGYPGNACLLLLSTSRFPVDNNKRHALPG